MSKVKYGFRKFQKKLTRDSNPNTLSLPRELSHPYPSGTKIYFKLTLFNDGPKDLWIPMVTSGRSDYVTVDHKWSYKAYNDKEAEDFPTKEELSNLSLILIEYPYTHGLILDEHNHILRG